MSKEYILSHRIVALREGNSVELSPPTHSQPELANSAKKSGASDDSNGKGDIEAILAAAADAILTKGAAHTAGDATCIENAIGRRHAQELRRVGMALLLRGGGRLCHRRMPWMDA